MVGMCPTPSGHLSPPCPALRAAMVNCTPKMTAIKQTNKNRKKLPGSDRSSAWRCLGCSMAVCPAVLAVSGCPCTVAVHLPVATARNRHGGCGCSRSLWSGTVGPLPGCRSSWGCPAPGWGCCSTRTRVLLPCTPRAACGTAFIQGSILPPLLSFPSSVLYLFPPVLLWLGSLRKGCQLPGWGAALQRGLDADMPNKDAALPLPFFF